MFSSFINQEIKTAENIKDRNNRHNVVRTLKRINELIKKYENINGLFIFAGIDEFDDEIFEVLIPPFESKLFIYECGSKFQISIFEDFFKEIFQGSVIIADGDQALIYAYNGIFKKIKTINANLIKKHSKGGSSSARFGRLAEESRHMYSEHVVDHLNKLESSNNWISGSEDIVSRILESKNLNVKLSRSPIILKASNNTIVENNNYFKSLMIQQPLMDKYFQQIIDLINIEPDFLLFGADEILLNIADVEFLISPNDPKQLFGDYSELFKNKFIKLELNSKYYQYLFQYDCVAKLYFKSRQNIDIDSRKNIDIDDLVERDSIV